jgi:hypothetical protein
MAFLSLEDAAASLGLSTDVLKDLARKKIIRSLSDGGKMMFKSEEVEAYREANAPDAGESLMLDEPMNFELPPPENTVAQTEAEGGSFAPLMDDGDWDNIKIKTDDPVGATTEMLTPAMAAKALSSDSPFELAPEEPAFRLQEETPAPTKEPSSGSSEGVFSVSGDSSSEFEVGSSSDFSLEAASEASFDMGDSLNLAPEDADSVGSESFAIEAADSSSVFEVDGSSGIESGSDSAFEIALEDSSSQEGGLAIEDGSGSEALPLDLMDADISGTVDNLDLDMIDEGSDSEVVPVDDDGDINAGTLATPTRGRRTQLMTDSDDLEEDLESIEDDDARPVGAMVAAPQPWGVLPVLFLTPAFLIMTLMVFLTFEILLSSIGFFQGGKVSTVLLKPMMDIVDPAASKLLN